MSENVAAKPRRLWLYLPFAALMVLALGWTGLWFYGRHRIGQELDNQFARQASLGRVWSCPDRRIGGYPFRIEISCEKPTFAADRGQNGAVAGTLGRLSVTAQTAGVVSLAHIVGRFDGPLVLNEEGFGRTTINWTSALASLRGFRNRLERVSLDLTAPEALVEPRGGEPVRLKAAAIEAHLREGVLPADPGTYDVAFRMTQAEVPPLDAMLGSRDPVNLLLDGKILNVGPIDRRDWRATIENWRTRNGVFRVEQFNLTKGVPRLEAKGELRLDALKRLEGRLDANFVNAGPLLQQFGIGLGDGAAGRLGGGAGALLGGLLGGTRPPAEGQRDRNLRLPLVLGDGRVAVGPFRIPGLQLRPVY
jgi:hypothetical protein